MANSYVAPYSGGYVVVVNGVWYGPGCTAMGGGWPAPAAAVWSDLIAAQNCFNAKGGAPATLVTPSTPILPGGDVNTSGIYKFIETNWPLLAGAGVLYMLLKKKR